MRIKLNGLQDGMEEMQDIIDEEKVKIRGIVDEFSSLMEFKLLEPRNITKINWQECEIKDLIEMIWQEFREMTNAIEQNKTYTMVREECVDIANFAMMIADNYNNLKSEVKNESNLPV